MKEKVLTAMLALVLVGGAGYLAVTTTGAEAGRSDPVGIPDSNPVFEPDDDGVCEKHETVVKTTPSGKQVNVPCLAAGLDDGDDGEDASAAGSTKPGKGHGR